VDPQIASYNFSKDQDLIFPNGYIQTDHTITASAEGQLTSGCFLRDDTTSMSQLNSSWATNVTIPSFPYPTSPNSDLIPLLNLTSNTTACGISPILNITLLNTSAGANYIPYLNYTTSNLWSWAPGEPKNYSTDTSGDIFRCATTNLDLLGRWTVSDCSSKRYSACQVPDQRYNWTFTSYPIAYSFAELVCPAPSVFAAPRTALENSYLTQAMRDSGIDFTSTGGPWIDFNSLSTDGCWVTGGANAQCPYDEDNEQSEKQQILVCYPTPR